MVPDLKSKIRVAFVVESFPRVPETFIINQVADLLDRGVDVEIFAFHRGDDESISSRFYNYGMSNFTHYLCPASCKFGRVLGAVPLLMWLLRRDPRLLLRTLNVFKYGRFALSFKLPYWVTPFLGKRFDLVHCHFATVANVFLIIKDILRLELPLVTSCYGYDVSATLRHCSNDFYARLKREADLFFVMSNNMKERVVAFGFPEAKVRVLPVSIDVNAYPFSDRILPVAKSVQLVSVGRFVQKKGFDDLLRALAIVKRKTSKPFYCSIVGGGPLDAELRQLADSLGLSDVINFDGYMKIDDIIRLLGEKHIMVQPSKTADDGDME
jgi:colanic acid/amylovoran biosynthesis glycosyltransferase